MKLKANIALSILNTFLNICFPLLTLPIAARTLGPDMLGVVNFALALNAPVGALLSLGLTGYAVIWVAKLHDDKKAIEKFFYEVIILQLLMAIPAWLIFQLLIYYHGGWNTNVAIFQVAAANIVLTSLNCEWFFIGQQRFLFMTLRNVVIKLVVLAIVIAFVRSRTDALYYIVALSVGLSGSQLVNFAFAASELSFRGLKLAPFLHFRNLKFFAPLQATTTLQTSFDKMAAGFMIAPSALAFYTLADRLCSIATSLSGAVVGVMLPRQSRAIIVTGAHVVHADIAKAFLLVLPFSVLLLVGMALTGSAWSVLLFGGIYAPVGDILNVLKWSMVLYIVTQFIGNMMLLPMGRQSAYLIATGAGLAVQIVAIPAATLFAGALGTAAGMILSNIAMLAVMLFLCRTELVPILTGMLRSWDTWRRIGAGIVVELCFRPFPLPDHPSLLHAILYTLAIIFSYVAFLIISGDTWLRNIAIANRHNPVSTS